MIEAEIPHILIRPHLALGRTLKTPQSRRKVPLVGASLLAAQRLTKRSGWVFPRYAVDGKIKATDASNTINKWLRAQTGAKEKTNHCIRHAFKDRLRAANLSEDIQKAIMGHGDASIARSYGDGYPLVLLREEMLLMPQVAPAD